MSCELTQTSLHGYLDGELGAERAAEFERHLEHCPQCLAELEAQETLRKALNQPGMYERAPEGLRRRVREAGRVRSEVVPLGRSWRWGWLAAAAAALVVALASWGVVNVLRNRTTNALAAELVDAHLRSLQGNHLEDVVSTDQHTVKPWFDGKIDFAPPVEDLAGDGFPLQGGRVEFVRGRDSAALVYGRRKHVINVFVWPEAGADEAGREGSALGYNWVDWKKGGMAFFAVSDTGLDDLRELRHLLRHE